jgi:hypothetical protein
MTEIFVSALGDDNSQGSEKAPFRTLHRAQKEAFTLQYDDVNIVIGSGTYYLDKPLVFDSAHCSAKKRKILFKAGSGEKPRISGGITISEKWMEMGDGAWKCTITNPILREKGFTQLFFKGKRQTLSRYPKEGYCYPAPGKLSWPHQEFAFNPTDFTKKTWKKPEEAVLHIFGKNHWGNLQWKISDIDWNTHTIFLGEGGYQINDIIQGEEGSGLDERSAYYIENVFEELSNPGEWYFDKDKGELYMIPEDGVDLNSSLIEVPVLTQLIEIKGTQRRPVSNIAFDGLYFTHTASTFFEEYEAPSLGDWTIFRGGAIFMEGAEDCSITQCTFKDVGGNAIFVSNYNRRLEVCNNLITQVGDSAICVVGTKNASIGSNHKYPANIDIANNTIHDIGIFGKQTAGVFISISRDNIISHNHIYNTPRAAICLNDGTWGGHLIEFNDIHDTVQETGDHGPFNSWGRERFWSMQQSHGPVSHSAGDVKLDCKHTVVIRNNRFEDYKGWGIDLDDGSSNFHVYNNLCIGISIKLREGDYRLIENNIFINGANPPGFHIGYEYNHDRFVRNIIVMSSKHDNPEVDIDFQKGDGGGKIYEIIGPPLKGPILKEINHNLFFNDIGKFNATIHYRPLGSSSIDYDLKEWQGLGYDQDSLFADPLFESISEGNYTLQAESPGHAMGFEEFDMTQYGVIEKNKEY